MIPQAFLNLERRSPHRRGRHLLLLLLLLHWCLHPITFNTIHIEASRRDMSGLQYAFDGVLTGSASSGACVGDPGVGGSNSVMVFPETARQTKVR